MPLLNRIIQENHNYFKNLEQKIKEKLSLLPKGALKKRKINNRAYFYLQFRQGSKIKHKYLGKDYPEETLKQLVERQLLLKQLKDLTTKLKAELKVLNKLNKSGI